MQTHEASIQHRHVHRINTSHGVRSTLISLVALLVALLPVFPADAGIRVVTYNINADTGTSTPQPGLNTVLQAIGNEHLAGSATPIDVLALQELYFTPSTTLQPLVTQLNAIYGSGAYAFDSFVGGTNGNSTGNGPNGLVYRTSTIQVVQAVGIGTASTSGAPRQPIRYTLHPIGYPSTADFYIYVSHYKASSGSTNATRRQIEAAEIRADADALGAGAHIIYAGDFNLTGGSTEQAYQTLIGPGNGQAHDPVNPAGNWSNTAPFVSLCSESATTLNARFDFLLISGAMLNQPGLQFVNGSYTVFGNNGSTAFGGNVSAASNTALSDLANRTQVLSLLTTVTDHLPVVADFNVVGLSAPAAPTNALASPGTVCPGSGTTLSATVPAGQTVDWSTGACGGSLVGSGTSIVVTPNASTTYFARARTIATGQVSTACAPVNVTTYQPLSLTQQPLPQTVCTTDTAHFTVAATGSPSAQYQWQWQPTPGGAWLNLAEGLNPYQGTNSLEASGTTSSSLAARVLWGIGGNLNVRCAASNACGTATSDAAALSVPPACCDPIDFNNDGLFPDAADIDDFLSVFSGGPCSNDPNCHDTDFNNDNLFPDAADIDSLLSVFSGGPCI